MMPILMRDRTNNNGSNHLLDQKNSIYFGWDHVLSTYKWIAAKSEIVDWESEF